MGNDPGQVTIGSDDHYSTISLQLHVVYLGIREYISDTHDTPSDNNAFLVKLLCDKNNKLHKLYIINCAGFKQNSLGELVDSYNKPVVFDINGTTIKIIADGYTLVAPARGNEFSDVRIDRSNKQLK